MNGLMAAFETLTAPQAEVISAATTMFSALLVAVFAPLVFHLLTRGGLKDFNAAVTELKSAADSAKTQSQTIRDTMGTVRGVSSQVTDLGVLIASVQEALANTQNTLLEGRPEEPVVSNGHRTDVSVHERIKIIWRGLQEVVERRASNPQINGNTRARYARMDRRSYLTLIETLLDEGKLAGSTEDWRAAYYLWAGAKNPATSVSETDVQRMQQLERTLRSQNSGDDVAEAALPSAPTLSPGVTMMPTKPRDVARDSLRRAQQLRESGEEDEHPSPG